MPLHYTHKLPVQELGGEAWVKDLFLLKKLLPLASSDAFKQRVFQVKKVRTTHTMEPWATV